MLPSIASPWFWSEKLIAFAVLHQSVELLEIRNSYSDAGIWRWNLIRKDFERFPAAVRRLLDALLEYRHFLALLWIQLFSAAYLLTVKDPSAVSLALMLAVSVLVSIRWRGTFNGGADYMTVLVLLMLVASRVFEHHQAIRIGCLWYLAIQTCLSYFISGLVKVRSAAWRRGDALAIFVSGPPYEAPQTVKRWFSKQPVRLAASWAVILFEIGFPVALFDPRLCVAVIVAALLFHLANCYVFGLNRFLFAWAAAYPALYYCSL